MANQLIAMDKSPSVQPIGVGKTLRMIIGNAVCLKVRLDAEEVFQVDQLCVGMNAGIKGGIHPLTELFEEHKLTIGVYY